MSEIEMDVIPDLTRLSDLKFVKFRTRERGDAAKIRSAQVVPLLKLVVWAAAYSRVTMRREKKS